MNFDEGVVQPACHRNPAKRLGVDFRQPRAEPFVFSRMLFGDDKVRQMVRSILPSTWRGAHRARAFAHRSARRGIRLELHALTRDPSLWDDADEGETAKELDPWLVSRRRGSDKLNHFQRWATRITSELPLHDRLSHVRALVPRGVIGEHALVHLRHLTAFETQPRFTSWRWWRLPEPEMHRGEQAVLLRRIVNEGALRPFNAGLRAVMNRVALEKHAPPSPPMRRKLLGIHDVLPFLDDLARRGAEPLSDATRAMCAAFKRDGALTLSA